MSLLNISFPLRHELDSLFEPLVEMSVQRIPDRYLGRTDEPLPAAEGYLIITRVVDRNGEALEERVLRDPQITLGPKEDVRWLPPGQDVTYSTRRDSPARLLAWRRSLLIRHTSKDVYVLCDASRGRGPAMKAMEGVPIDVLLMTHLREARNDLSGSSLPYSNMAGNTSLYTFNTA